MNLQALTLYLRNSQKELIIFKDQPYACRTSETFLELQI